MSLSFKSRQMDSEALCKQKITQRAVFLFSVALIHHPASSGVCTREDEKETQTVKRVMYLID